MRRGEGDGPARGRGGLFLDTLGADTPQEQLKEFQINDTSGRFSGLGTIEKPSLVPGGLFESGHPVSV